jgi:folate-dependent phosphoribosylglycinamide formyltransferase PurN
MKYAGSEDDAAVIERHFAARDASEEAYFAHDTDVTPPSRRVVAGGCNDPDEIARMRDLAPDVVLVFGTGLLKQPLIDSFPGRVMNIHLGLSPYYRGAGTNFWPLVNREPEYVGATIHYLDAGIDTGPILSHARPRIERGDGPHDIGNRTIVAAAQALLRAAAAHVSGVARAVPQWGRGRLYQRKDFSADAVRTLYRNFETGMIEEYLAARASRDAAVRLIEPERVA